MVKITPEMRIKSNERFHIVCKRVDDNIKRAVEEGKCIAHFSCDMDADRDVYDRVKAAYESEGYRIIPTGFSGGVYQRTEEICW